MSLFPARCFFVVRTECELVHPHVVHNRVNIVQELHQKQAASKEQTNSQMPLVS